LSRLWFVGSLFIHRTPRIVMAGLVPAIHDLKAAVEGNSWMPGTGRA